ncbi:LysR family transcriptional regulator [Phreatobacter sp. AB_2022a]|uniref:LysR family transcriptional regulator n=1 Tax=Phreatobacter sp. AB_2022a TaxID=3003134 RepID=UPI0022873105|nr:LysR family transcriptional regulator [Phreatobacter sp. AB_2022a]MCZ0733168.1 LysR family transcriptional regulator [Phreatobacter sp. AB_2022a]
MALEIHSLAYFVRTLQRRSMKQAAADLGVRTSTVSRALGVLEYELATKLLVRRPDGVVASFEGEQLNRSASLILNWTARLPDVVAGRPAAPGATMPADAAPALATLRALAGAPVSLRTLAHFALAVEERSISGAARRLNITQPTLGRRMAELERFLGVPLFARGRTGSSPTPAALRLHASAIEIEALARGILKRADIGFLHQVRDFRLGSVMPAGVDSNLAVLLAGIIEDYTKRDRNRFVSVSTGPAQFLMEQLLAGALDAAIVDTAEVPADFMRLEIARRPLLVMVPASAYRDGDRAEDLIGRLPLALPMTGTGLRRAIDQLVAHGPDAPRRTIECGSIPVLMRLVINGACCTIIPEGALPQADPRVRALGLAGAVLVTQLIWMPAKQDSAQVRLIRELVQQRPFA